MVRLLEHKGKGVLQKAGIQIPLGEVAGTAEKAKKICERIGKPVVVKAQIFAGGRFKAGGIKFANTPIEAEKAASQLLGSKVKGFYVAEVLVEEKLEIEKEFYAGIIINDSWRVRSPVMIFSTEGGVDIEETARKTPEKVAKTIINVLEGIKKEEAENLTLQVGVPKILLPDLGQTLYALYQAFRSNEARTVEINPLVLTKNGSLIASDCRMIIDDTAATRYPELEIEIPRDSETPPTPLDKLAWKIEEEDYRGVAYFAQLASESDNEEYIGFHGIGGGGAMLGLDALHSNGLKTLNYADTSGNPTAAKVYRIAKVILSQPRIVGYFLSGAVIASQEQWHHAHGLVKAFRETLAEKQGFPVLILIAGNKEAEAIEILKEGLDKLPIKLEVYGRDYVYKLDYLAKRMKQLVKDYKPGKHGE